MALTFGPLNIGINPKSPDNVQVTNYITGKPAVLTSPVQVLDDGSITFTVAESGFYTIRAIQAYQWAKMTINLREPIEASPDTPGVRVHSQLQGLTSDDHSQQSNA